MRRWLLSFLRAGWMFSLVLLLTLIGYYIFLVFQLGPSLAFREETYAVVLSHVPDGLSIVWFAALLQSLQLMATPERQE